MTVKYPKEIKRAAAKLLATRPDRVLTPAEEVLRDCLADTGLPYPCRLCGEWSDPSAELSDARGLSYCESCNAEALMENDHNDGFHIEAPVEECKLCRCSSAVPERESADGWCPKARKAGSPFCEEHDAEASKHYAADRARSTEM